MTADNPLQDALYAALARVEDPELRRPITELGMVETALVHPELDEHGEPIPGRHWAEVTVLLTIEGCPLKNTIEQQVRDAATTVEGIERVQLQVGAMNPQQRSALRSMLKPERSNPFTAPGSLTRARRTRRQDSRSWRTYPRHPYRTPRRTRGSANRVR